MHNVTHDVTLSAKYFYTACTWTPQSIEASLHLIASIIDIIAEPCMISIGPVQVINKHGYNIIAGRGRLAWTLKLSITFLAERCMHIIGSASLILGYLGIALCSCIL